MGKKSRVPRFVDLDVPADTKRDLVLAHILEGPGDTWHHVSELMKVQYGPFTVAEKDLLDLPEQQRADAVRHLLTYAQMELRSPAPVEAREAAARCAANSQQTLNRLMLRSAAPDEPCMRCIVANAAEGIVCICGHDWVCHPTGAQHQEPCSHCDCAQMTTPA
ncbi:hypothetical protein ACIQI7_32590 [Kitasatospora sp. NPDC092039]|uniref:hypothetical protein n=1 Tax=Kitasatospora sp. NPDC092039 TaxID=3364086 RepID=UPI003805C57D